MTIQRRFLVSTVIGGIVAGLLSATFAMPGFMLAASPGMMLSMAIAGNVHALSTSFIFVGNWIFYSLIILGIVAIARRLRGQTHR